MGNRNPTFVANAFIITVIRRQAMWPIERIRREHADGGKSFFFDAKFARERSSGEKTDGRAGSPPLLYGGERLKGQQPSEHVIVVEGEKKVDELRKRFGAVAVSGDSGADSKWLAEHAKLLRGFRVVLWPDSDDAGEKYIAKAAAAIRADDPTANIRVVRPFPPAAKGEKGKDVCDWPGEADAFSHLMAGAEQYRVAAHGDEGPRPLMRETPAGEAFPVDALGEVLGGAVKGIVDIAQCPEALTAGSVLSAAALAAQALADVVFPATGQAKPLSLYMLTVGSSGERKSASDDFALAPVRQREAELQTQRDIDLTVWKATHRAWELSKKRAEQGKDLHAIRQELLKLGDEPPPPLAWPRLAGRNSKNSRNSRSHDENTKSLPQAPEDTAKAMTHVMENKEITPLAELYDHEFGRPCFRAGDAAIPAIPAVVVEKQRDGVAIPQQVSAIPSGGIAKNSNRPAIPAMASAPPFRLTSSPSAHSSITVLRETMAAENEPCSVTLEQGGPLRMRPAPLSPRITEAEKAAHRDFIERLSEAPIWARYLPVASAEGTES